MRRLPLVAATGGLLLACSIPVSGQVSPGQEPAVPEKAGKVLAAFRISGDAPAPRIDGRLDDEVWAVADAIDDLVQDEPDNLAPPTERTVVQVAYDNRHIYVAVRCYERDASQIARGLGRRDNFPPSDLIAISFDPRHDHLTAYTFRTNPSGVQGDLTYFDDTRSDNDYNGVWEVGTSVTTEGWIAEFQIPFSQMRFTLPTGNEAVWGFQVRRDIRRRGEVARWIPSPRGVQGFVSRFGHLTFSDRPSPPRRLELLPFTLGRHESRPGAAPSRQAIDGGLDLRLGLGTSATLSATINPDFGQVEQDPAVLNLSVFETQFAERRPFFLEDSRTFVLQYSQFPDFYSPRIGRTPGRLPLRPGDRLISKPERTTILGASKITGKKSGWTYGGLGALTAREYATVETTTTQADGAELFSRADRLIEPATMYSVGRLQRDILRGTSNVGVIGTAVMRERDLDAFTGGGDAAIRWDRNRYYWNGHWVVTRAPIAGVTRHGHGGATNFSFSSKHLGLSGHFDHFGRTFRNTDLGFLTSRVNKSNVNGGISFSQPDRWGISRRLEVWFGADQTWNGDNLNIGRYINTGMYLQFLNFWSTNLNIWHGYRGFDDLDTRGGPPIVRPASTGMNVGVNSDSRKSWGASLSGNVSRDAEDGWSAGISPSVRLQPSARLQSSVGVNYNFGRDIAQWITNRDVNDDGLTDHVYGLLRRNVISITARGTYAFSRDMTLEVYMQPFVAVGDYTNIRRLARPRSFEFEPAAIPSNPDFNNKSLRSNVVMRWEYVRGSTLFVVWQSTSADPSRPGVFSPWRDLGDAFRGQGTQVFMVKMSYWVGL